MNETKCKAEANVYGLLNGLLTDQDVISWADSLIMQSEMPDDWLIDLCGCKKGDTKKIIGLLKSANGSPDASCVNKEILSLYSSKTHPFSLYGADEIPTDFVYPQTLEAMAKSGGYTYNALIEWLDRKWSYMGSLLQHVKEVNPSLVPFGKLDDRFLCLDKNHMVHIVDIVDKNQVMIGSFESWYVEYLNEANRGCWYVSA